jgi:hypothetical protein
VSGPGGVDDATLIRIILDASAVRAFGQNEAVGEIISEINSEGAAFATTTAALAEALAAGADRALIEILRANTGCLVIASTLDWDGLGRFLDLTRPGPDALHDVADSDLVMLATRTDAFILTEQPDRYTDISASVVTIRLEEPWAD